MLSSQQDDDDYEQTDKTLKVIVWLVVIMWVLNQLKLL